MGDRLKEERKKEERWRKPEKRRDGKELKGRNQKTKKKTERESEGKIGQGERRKGRRKESVKLEHSKRGMRGTCLDWVTARRKTQRRTQNQEPARGGQEDSTRWCRSSSKWVGPEQR